MNRKKLISQVFDKLNIDKVLSIDIQKGLKSYDQEISIQNEELLTDVLEERTNDIIQLPTSIQAMIIATWLNSLL